MVGMASVLDDQMPFPEKLPGGRSSITAEALAYSVSYEAL